MGNWGTYRSHISFSLELLLASRYLAVMFGNRRFVVLRNAIRDIIRSILRISKIPVMNKKRDIELDS